MVRIGSGSDSDSTSSYSDDESEDFFNNNWHGPPTLTTTTTTTIADAKLDIKEEDEPEIVVKIDDVAVSTSSSSDAVISLVKVQDGHSIKYTSIFDTLPDEIVLKIYRFIDIPGIGKVAQVCKRFHSLSNDLPLWRAIISEKTNVLEADSEVTRSYYIRKFKQFKERQKKIEEEQKRQRQVQKRIKREDRCANIMTYMAYNRVHEWLITFSLIFITIASVLKLDEVISWDWSLIFIPFYFIIFQILYAPIMYDGASSYFQKSFEDDLSEDNRYCGPIFYLLLFILPLGHRADWKRRFLVYFNIAMTISFLIFFCVKTSLPESIGWWLVFLPLLLQLFVVIIALILGNYDRIWEDDQWVDRLLWIAMSIILMLAFIFIFLKLDNKVDWSWYIALVPLFIVEGLVVIIPCVLTGVSVFGGYNMRYRTRWSEDISAFCIVAVMISILLIAPLLILEVLLAQRAEGDRDTSYVLIFVPLFILEGCGCLGCVVINFIASFD